MIIAAEAGITNHHHHNYHHHHYHIHHYRTYRYQFQMYQYHNQQNKIKSLQATKQSPRPKKPELTSAKNNEENGFRQTRFWQGFGLWGHYVLKSLYNGKSNK